MLNTHRVQLLQIVLTLSVSAPPVVAQEPTGDPLSPILRPALKSMVDVVLENQREGREYNDDDFPMAAADFAAFRGEVIDRLVNSMGLQQWVVRRPLGKQSPLAGRFQDRLLKSIDHHNVTMEVHAVTFPDTGLVVPMVVCLPAGTEPRPGVCVFSGHSSHGLRDLVLNLDSYQAGLAVRLAQAGFVTIAVEKVDSGYLSRDGASGSDEVEVASFWLGWGPVTRAHQLKACLAASEILATHSRVDAGRLGAAGVSLGGWLSVQTALLSDRIAAVADFGVKTLLIPDVTTSHEFRGIRDWCHVLPGVSSLCERNLLSLAYCPRPLLAGHGRRDAGSSRDAPRHYRQLYEAQYATLGRADRFNYYTHDGGDSMPPDRVITYFREQFDRRKSAAERVGHLQGEMVGEVTTESAILQSRLTKLNLDEAGDVPGSPGVARFEIADNPEFVSPQATAWLDAVPAADYVVKTKVAGLEPATKYYYRLQFGNDQSDTRRGPTRTFRTHHPPDAIANHSFVVVTGMNYHYFHHGGEVSGPSHRQAYRGSDKHLGYPALASILELQPDFLVGTGDNVYYDSPRDPAARTAAEMRKKWHEQFVQPRYVDLFGQVPTYWEKDDHDYRYDDCDNTGEQAPTVDLGLRLFREQVPITDPEDTQAVTYRTHRMGRLLQVWLPENRDYRSPNLAPDGPAKTIWGSTQRAWLQETLLKSDATFKIIVSPTPMIGPDDLRKKDNHCDIGGFRHERDSFFDWAIEHQLLDRGLYLVCGDRHWQYHAIHPTGFEEFSCGALVDANSRLGRHPGDPQSTDPHARVKQPYASTQPSGGFLGVFVSADKEQRAATATIRFYDEQGTLLHAVTRQQEL